MVSIVGARGVGKSTVTSLLSGNHSMFVTGSGSVGTTTTGADISTIIPTTDYSDILGEQLGIELSKVIHCAFPHLMIRIVKLRLRSGSVQALSGSLRLSQALSGCLKLS